MRSTFASVAEELVSREVLKRMMNHAAAGGVTLEPSKALASTSAAFRQLADVARRAAQLVVRGDKRPQHPHELGPLWRRQRLEHVLLSSQNRRDGRIQ